MVMNINQKIQAYHGSMAGEHHRYRSWEHCYSYFRRVVPNAIASDQKHAALQLAFYLASWGMYRGSSFLLQHAYTIHLGVIDLLAAPRFSVLWDREFGASESDTELVPIILDAIDSVRTAYKPFAPTKDSQQPTDTLVTKVILGTFGCLPACDRYFINGFKDTGFSYSYLNGRFIERILEFSRINISKLREEQTRIKVNGGMHYPLMKLVDMYFWQIGFEKGTQNDEV
jgi:hypothetical protein